MSELRWCFGEACRGPQPVENFRHPNGRQCWTCYKDKQRPKAKERKRRARRNPLIAERLRAIARAYWHRVNTEEHLADLRMKKKIRYGEDAEYRERMIGYNRKWRAANVKPAVQCRGQAKATGKRCTRLTHNLAGCQWHRQARAKAA